MNRNAAAAALLAVLAGFAWLAVAMPGTPEAAPHSARSTAFSAERAMVHVQALAAAPRPVGSPAHDRARAYVVEQLRELGLEPQVHETVAVAPRTWRGAMARVRNVVARLPGLDDDPEAPAVLLMAHYDSTQSSPGASDDAVGVAVLLETLRALREAQVPRHDVIALFTDAEEAGLIGAEGFMADHPWADRIGVVLNFEARGTRGPALMFETGADNRWLIERFAEAVPDPVAASYSYEVYRRLPNDTDYSVFRRQGIPGLNFAHIHGAVGYHTTEDSIERLDPDSLQHHGDSALALARALGDTDLPQRGSAPSGDAVYFNPLGSFFVHFSAGWVPVLAGLLGVGVLGVLVLALIRRRVGAGALAGGFLAWTLLVAGAVGLGMTVAGALFPIVLDFRIWGDQSSVAWILFGWILVSLGVGSALYAVVRRWLPAQGWVAGGLLLWTVVAVPVSFAAPGASYLFLFPLAAQLAAAGWFLLRPVPASAVETGSGAPARAEDAARPSRGLWLLLALAGGIVALVWASTLGLVAVGLQFGAVVACGALAVLLLALLAPQVETITAGLPGPRWLLGAVLAVAGVGLVLAAQGASRFGVDTPRPTSLFYALDAESGEALWGTFEQHPTEWTRSVVEGEEWATLPRFLGHTGAVAHAPAPALDLPAPEIEVLERDGGRYRARVVPPPETGRIRLILEPASALREVRVDGRELEVTGGESLGVLYYAPPATGVEVEVVTDPGAEAPELAAIAQWLRLPGEGEGGPRPRGPGLMPTLRTVDTDVTMVRTAVALDAAGAGDGAASADAAEELAEGLAGDGGTSTGGTDPVE